VLTFHGLSADGHDPELLGHADHPSVAMFTEVCEHLAKNYHVISSSDVVRARRQGKRLPDRAVVITFDDGYESNALLAWPVLKRLRIPATIFLTTGFIDGTVLPWFVRLEMALSRTQATTIFEHPLTTVEERSAAYGALCQRFKSLSTREAMSLLAQIEDALDVHVRPGDALPAPLRPMTWNTARDLWKSGIIEFGGHTHTHPVLGRCDEPTQRDEIATCSARIREELGHTPSVFAYTNGMSGDFDATTQRLLREAKFECAFTMQSGFVNTSDDALALPRLGNPTSCVEAEAMVSGITERLRQMRQWLKPKRPLTEVPA
jgi:peptidoglycan/xylan/chitin deacetylase (PgdA/CDA1 family)